MDWIWIIIGMAVVCVFACIAAAVTAIRVTSSGNREKRPGYQDVLVRNGVDVKAMKYIHDVSLFPNQDGIEAFPTVLTEDNLNKWTISLTDINSGTRYRSSFSGQLVIGRDPAAMGGDKKLILGDWGVSKTHCRIISKGNEIELEDMGSKNGTYLNGAVLSGRGLLHTGDKVTIGNTTFAVDISKG